MDLRKDRKWSFKVLEQQEAEIESRYAQSARGVCAPQSSSFSSLSVSSWIFKSASSYTGHLLTPLLGEDLRDPVLVRFTSPCRSSVSLATASILSVHQLLSLSLLPLNLFVCQRRHYQQYPWHSVLNFTTLITITRGFLIRPEAWCEEKEMTSSSCRLILYPTPCNSLPKKKNYFSIGVWVRDHRCSRYDAEILSPNIICCHGEVRHLWVCSFRLTSEEECRLYLCWVSIELEFHLNAFYWIGVWFHKEQGPIPIESIMLLIIIIIQVRWLG